MYVKATPTGAELVEDFRRNSLKIELHPRNRAEAICYLEQQLASQRFIFHLDGKTECRLVEESIMVAEVIARQKPDKNWAEVQTANAFPLEERNIYNFR